MEIEFLGGRGTQEEKLWKLQCGSTVKLSRKRKSWGWGVKPKKPKSSIEYF